ncbi:DUF2637 domain-containing protein [Streptomyces sp. NBC_00183]|uniref:DUF2637 domain-containing protein n=1 Tax=Streptomyces sp. NBC_00183 TaxID=2903633 RepID=UPI002253378A|nr:DUF2637 domain-containing protein [Streptomyces sp. NBC_00183]MCX5288735.1 DUF2637 domain-containing protein [Streptomyces sp. NBC_00183]
MTTTPTPEAPASGVPPLTRPELGLAGVGAFAAAAVGALGLISSFDAVSATAVSWGFHSPWMLPVGIDVAIPVFTVANLLLIRMDMALAWVRFVPWLLTLITCGLNIAAGHSLSAKVAHGTMPLLWVVFSEIGAHIYAVRIGAATGRRMEKIRFSRWLLAFPSTFALWRRMTLWEVTSYSEALAREKERQLARADLREQYGRKWRSKTPRRERVLLRMGDLAPATEETTPAPAEPPAPPADPKPRPRRQTATKTKAKAQRTFEELLTEARTVTAEWKDAELTADRIRTAVHCSATNARALRDALKSERTDGRPLRSVDDAEGEATEAEAA